MYGRYQRRLVAMASVGLLAAIACDDVLLDRGAAEDVGSPGPTAVDAGQVGSESDSGIDSTEDAGDGSGSSSDAGVADAGPAVLCGGFFGFCADAASTYCNFRRHTCGATDESGVCTPRPAACPTDVEPVCGCDRQNYANECAAYQAGVDVSDFGCTVPPGTFACGYRFCTIGTSYCRRDFPASPADPVIYSCPSLPAECAGIPACGCLANEPCGDTCDVLPGGHPRLTCVDM